VRALALAAFVAMLAAGCGGDHSTAPVGDRIVVAALGDSITSGSPGYDPDKTQRKLLGFGGDEHSQWEYWARLKDPRLLFRNCGVYGQRTDEIALRLHACAKGADVLVVQGGINDIAQGVPVATVARNLDAMVRRGKALGLRVALADVLPWNNGDDRAAQHIIQLNELVHAIADRLGVPLLPFHDTLVDPEQPFRMRADWTDDGNHPSVEGHRLLGERAFRT